MYQYQNYDPQGHASQTYNEILDFLFDRFYDGDNDQKLFQHFTNHKNKRFKMDIAFDALFAQILNQRFNTCCDKYLTIDAELFTRNMKFIKKINGLFSNKEYISYRDYLFLDQKIKREEKSPAFKWIIEDLPYFRNAKNVEQFRIEFGDRCLLIPEDNLAQIIQQANDDNFDELKMHYNNFFMKCIRDGINTRVLNYLEDVFCRYENKEAMLSLETIKSLEKTLGTQLVGSNKEQIEVNKQLRGIAQASSYVNDFENSQRLEAQIRVIEKVLERFSALNIFKQKQIKLKLARFGSLLSGFASLQSDLDVTILTNCYVNEVEFLTTLNQFLEREYRVRSGEIRKSTNLITAAKNPLIEIGVHERGKPSIKIDILVNNILGVINSKFLRVYSQVKWIKNLGLLVKMWGKTQALIDKSKISSYAMILLLIHFLIKKKYVKPIMDSRDRDPSMPHFMYKRNKQSQVQIFEVYYEFKIEKKEVTAYERVNYANILYEFFKFYSTQIWNLSDRQKIITVDMSNDKEIEESCVITIKDPFDKTHNPGRIKIEHKDFMKQKFQFAENVMREIEKPKNFKNCSEKIRFLFESRN